MKKRLIAVIVAISLILISLGVFLAVRHVRNNRPPELSAIRERVIALIDASHEINDIFWGEGLTTYPRVYKEHYARVPFYLTKEGEEYAYSVVATDNKLYYYTFTDETVGDILAYQYCLKTGDGEYVDVENGSALTIADKIKYRYAKKIAAPVEDAAPLFTLNNSYYYALPDYEEKEAEFYYTASDQEYYDYVKDSAGYFTTSAIKEKAERVYAQEFLSSVYESVFTGITVSESSSGTLYARYIDYKDAEGNAYLMKSNLWQPAKVERVYLFDTMRMSEERRSKRTDVYVDIDTYVPGDEANVTTVTVSLTLQAGGWFLNSATY